MVRRGTAPSPAIRGAVLNGHWFDLARPLLAIGNGRCRRPAEARREIACFGFCPSCVIAQNWAEGFERKESSHSTLWGCSAYSMTSSASASTVGGTVRPSALAVFTLMTSEYLIGR